MGVPPYGSIRQKTAAAAAVAEDRPQEARYSPAPRRRCCYGSNSMKPYSTEEAEALQGLDGLEILLDGDLLVEDLEALVVAGLEPHVNQVQPGLAQRREHLRLDLLRAAADLPDHRPCRPRRGSRRSGRRRTAGRADRTSGKSSSWKRKIRTFRVSSSSYHLVDHLGGLRGPHRPCPARRGRRCGSSRTSRSRAAAAGEQRHAGQPSTCSGSLVAAGRGRSSRSRRGARPGSWRS